MRTLGDVPAAVTPTSPLVLLLLEDSAADRELVAAQLEDALPHAVVTSCATLAEATRHLGVQSYDVVLADLSLPDAGGLDVVRSVRAVTTQTALVVLTGRCDSALALDALAAGAQDYLVKGAHDGPRLATALLHAVQRQRAELRAHGYLQLARGLLDALEAPTCAVDHTGRITAVNAAWRAFTSENGGEPNRCSEGMLYLAACDDAADSAEGPVASEVGTGLRDVLSGRRARFEHEYPCHSPTQQRWFSVRIAPSEVRGSRGAVISHVDVTAMHQVRDELAHQALHDPLTGLPNRVLLADRLEQALTDTARRGSYVAVAFVDLDHFKRVNDSLGHPAGDRLLRLVAERLQQQVDVGDTLAHFSGDEFVVVWRDLADPDEGSVLSERLVQSLLEPFDLGPAVVTVSASVGVAVGRAPQAPQELLLAADAAMYDAKGHGRGRVRVFSSELRRGAGQRMATEVALREALAQGELVLHYQPVVDLQNGRVVGVEALVRWQHPQRGLLAPDTFIPVAESSGLVVPLGRFVLEQACADAARPGSPLQGLDVAVNLSARQLTQPDVLQHVRDALAHSGLMPGRLLLEVTESAVMEDAEAAGVALEALAALGVRIAIDDFGTGYSSLLYLRRYPISALKLDRAFVAGLGVSADDDAICSSVVSLAHAVGATSIGEGVETTEQYAALRGLGCRQAQGYLWSRPVSLDALPAALVAASQVPVPLRMRTARPEQPRLDPGVAGRIRTMHEAGASLHTIAAALNRAGARNPAGVRWHAHTVARHVAGRAEEPEPLGSAGR